MTVFTWEQFISTDFVYFDDDFITIVTNNNTVWTPLAELFRMRDFLAESHHEFSRQLLWGKD